MAIVIPSKNIYSVENTKIPENKVDKVEYLLKKPSIVNEVRDVFSTDFTENLQPTDESLNYFASTTEYVQGSFSSHAIAFAGLAETYFLTDVIIPAKIKNGRIKKAFSGVDKDNVANISYNISYKPRHGYATVVVERDAVTQNFSVKSIEKEDKPFDPEVGGYYPTFNENGDLYVKSEYKAESQLYAPVATAEITRIDQSNNATAEIEYIADEDVFKIKNLKILSRVETIEVGFGSSNLVQLISTLNGMYHEYVATRISISVKGEVVQLQFEDEAKSFGFANPDSPLEIEGSNIYQTTNYYSSGGKTVSSSYHNGYDLVQQYKNGKETAIIRCSVSDYYDEQGQKIIGTGKSKNLLPFDYEEQNYRGLSFVPNKDGSINVIGHSGESQHYVLSYNFPFVAGKKYSLTLIADNKKPATFSIYANVKRNNGSNTEYITFGENSSFVWQEDYELVEISISTITTTEINSILYPMLSEGDKIRITQYEFPNPNMTFKIYDIVLPMIRNAEGEDVPMSYDLYGAKKTFKVLGKRIYFDGAVWQELYLQEA